MNAVRDMFAALKRLGKCGEKRKTSMGKDRFGDVCSFADNIKVVL